MMIQQPKEFSWSIPPGLRVRNLLPLFLLTLVPSCGPVPPPAEGEAHSGVAEKSLAPDGDQGVADLRTLVDDWVEMWNSYDLNQVRELFLDDPRLTYFSSEKQGVIRGMEALIEHHQGFGFIPGGDARTSRLWLEGVETDPLGDAAVITGIWYFQSDGDSPEDPQKGPVTIVCLRDEVGWRFVHMNFSEYLPEETS